MARVTIKRHKPGTADSYWETYEVPVHGMSVMGVINYVREEYDCSLAYDRSCRHGRCRDCTIVVNGKSEICCLAPATGDMTIEPIKGYEVIRDLVVNLSKRVR